MNVRDFSEWDESDVHVRPNKKGSRPRTKDRPTFKEAIRGRVITVDRGRWSVVVDEGTENERTLIAARAKELRRTPIVTGDFVDVVGDTSGAKDTLARIVRLGERTSVLRRSADDTDPSGGVLGGQPVAAPADNATSMGAVVTTHVKRRARHLFS